MARQPNMVTIPSPATQELYGIDRIAAILNVGGKDTLFLTDSQLEAVRVALCPATPTPAPAHALLTRWRAHIAQRYRWSEVAVRRGMAGLELVHTCHGCGAGAVPFLDDGLCPICAEAWGHEKAAGAAAEAAEVAYPVIEKGPGGGG
jgi:hypothetical protein